jgi:hypothetical protein
MSFEDLLPYISGHFCNWFWREAQRWGNLQWHDMHTKIHENLSIDINILVGEALGYDNIILSYYTM